jgi:CheY-like chemotaxis protein
MIICDLGMPEMNGWVVGKRIKRYCAKRDLKKPPFILCTGWGFEAEDEDKIAESGVDQIAKKPLKFRDLVEIIQRFMT